MNIADETIWRWNDGAKVTWTAWDGTSRFDISSEMNQNCMYALRRDDSTVAVWKRTVCVRFPMFYVCGKATCRFPYQSIVAEGHFPFFHKCYRGMMNERLNARQAGQFCAEDGSESNPSKLAAPITKLEEDILHKRYEDRYMFYNYGDYNNDYKWIGYTFNIYEGGENWQWNDNTIGLGLADKAKYNDNEHAATNGRYYLERCTVLRANTWITKECDYIYGFICEREQPYVLSTCLRSKNARLMDGYYPNVPQSQRMKCYYLNADPKVMNYAEADRFCSSIGGYIMMPKTNHDLMRITDQLSRTKHKYFWIGADSFGHCFNKNYWCTPNQKHFKYQDGSNFTSNKLSWNTGEPNNLNHKEACIDVHRDNHCIKDYDCSKLRAVVCEVAHNNLRAHRNFDYITACKYKKALPEGKWNAEIEKPRSNGPWHAAPDDVCYRTPGKSRGFRRYVYSCSSLETDSDTATPRGKDQTRSLVLSILSTGATTSSYIGVFYYRPPPQMVKWLVKSFYGMSHDHWPGTSPTTWNWIPGNTGHFQAVVIKPNGKWVSVHVLEWHYVSCQKPGVASLSTWRRLHLLPRQPEFASGRDRLHSDSRSVAMVIIASFALCTLNGVY